MQIRIPYEIGHQPKDEGSSAPVAWSHVELAEADPRDAPDAIRYAGDGQPTKTFRLHGGSLWVEATAADGIFRAEDLRSIGPENYRYHPLLRDVRLRPNAPRGPASRITRADEALMRENARIIAKNAQDCLLIGGMLHNRSTGPLLRVDAVAERIEWFPGITRLELNPQHTRPASYPVHLRELAVETALLHAGQAVRDTSISRPEMLLDIKQDYDPLTNAQEAIAWSALWTARRKPMAELGAPAVVALARLRAAIEQRWPDHGVDYHGTHTELDMWPHERGRTSFPDGTHIAGLAVEFTNAIRAHIDPYYLKRARFFELVSAVLTRDRPAAPQFDSEDADALAGMAP